jgi:glycosyltransferase involved in cell wall biosynthesis
VRILLFSSTYPPLIGGVETVTRRLARELKDRGHDVTVVTNRYPRTLSPRENIDGITVIRRLYPNLLPSPGRRPIGVLVKQAASIPLAAIQLAGLYRLIKRMRPDIVNAHYFSYPVAYALIAARCAGVPAVLCFHGSDVPAVPYPATYPWAARWGCGAANQVICCSENLRSFLLHDLPRTEHSKVTVSHYGIDASPHGNYGRSVLHPPDMAASVETVATDAADEGPFVLLLARLVEKKGVGIAIRAMKLVLEKDQNAKLVIVGAGPLKAQLERLAATHHVTENVIFAGSVEHEAAMEITNRALFVVVPSHWEAFGMVCLEAMIAGKAVIASRSGGPSEIVVDGETGLLVPPRDEQALACAIQTLLDNPERAEEMGRRGRDRALAHFTWPQMAERYEKAFEHVVSGKARL